MPTGELHTVRLSDVVDSYDALSYTWGNRSEIGTIKVNDSLIKTRKNLHDFLRYLHRGKESITIWADAICIDQSSDKEKNHQVKLMKQIYSSARQTCVWLGVTSPNTKECLRIWNHQSPPEFRGGFEREALIEVLYHIYWTRTWIVQEVILARHVRVYLADQEIYLNSLLQFCDALVFTAEGLGPGRLRRQLEESPLNHLNTARIGNPQVPQNLATLLQYYGQTGCQFFCDRIFAMLGLITDSADPLCSKADDETSMSVIDYTMSRAQLFKALAELYAPTTLSPIVFTLYKLLNMSSVPKEQNNAEKFVSMPAYTVRMTPRLTNGLPVYSDALPFRSDGVEGRKQYKRFLKRSGWITSSFAGPGCLEKLDTFYVSDPAGPARNRWLRLYAKFSSGASYQLDTEYDYCDVLGCHAVTKSGKVEQTLRKVCHALKGSVLRRVNVQWDISLDLDRGNRLAGNAYTILMPYCAIELISQLLNYNEIEELFGSQHKILDVPMHTNWTD